MKFGGSFYVVYRPDRLVDLMDALRASKLEPKRMTMVYNSVGHLPSLVLLEAKKGASSGMFVTRPLILTEKDGTSTETCKNIYENGVFETYYERP